LLLEIRKIIESVDAHACRTKESEEKTMPGKMLFSPPALNERFKELFSNRDWESVRVACDYPTEYYVEGYQAKPFCKGAFREMDFSNKTSASKYSLVNILSWCIM
jgi:hypothetical protein